MPFDTPDFDAIRTGILRDIVNQRPGAAVGIDSDHAVRANAIGAAVEGLYQHQQWAVRQIFPDTADPDYLERWARLYKLSRKLSSAAAGTIDFSGAADSPIPIGTETKTAGGVSFVTTAAGTVGGGGTVTIAAQAVMPGSSGNQAEATPLTLTSAPAGILSEATIGAMTGGAEVEDDASLLARLLTRIQLPPHGGAAHDYRTWALEVEGVVNAWPLPLRRGLGTVDVVIGAAGGLPSIQLVADTQAHVNNLKPVSADCQVLGPTAVPVAVTGTLTLLAAGYALDGIVAGINDALANYFSTLTPGDTVYLKQLMSVITNTAGVVDYTLTAPVANVDTVVDESHVEQAVLGTVTLT